MGNVTDFAAQKTTASTYLEFADADSESVKIHLAAQKEISSAKSRGNAIDYLEALRRVELAEIRRVEMRGDRK